MISMQEREFSDSVRTSTCWGQDMIASGPYGECFVASVVWETPSTKANLQAKASKLTLVNATLKKATTNETCIHIPPRKHRLTSLF